MPLALLLVAALLIMVGVKGNYDAAGKLFQTTFFGASGQTGFIKWFGSILGLAILFRIIQAPRAGEAFIALLLVVYFLQHQGVLSTLEAAIQSTAAPVSTGPAGTTPTASTAPTAPTAATSSNNNTTFSTRYYTGSE